MKYYLIKITFTAGEGIAEYEPGDKVHKYYGREIKRSDEFVLKVEDKRHPDRSFDCIDAFVRDEGISSLYEAKRWFFRSRARFPQEGDWAVTAEVVEMTERRNEDGEVVWEPSPLNHRTYEW